MVIIWLFIGLIPISLSVWALLDCAQRPPWAWSFAGRNQVAWLGAIAFGIFLLIFGMTISLWYLIRIRPHIAAVEAGDFRGLDPS
ncbi:MAG: hypothetical protein ACI8XD_001913 [Thermoproteota archaeon]